MRKKIYKKKYENNMCFVLVCAFDRNKTLNNTKLKIVIKNYKQKQIKFKIWRENL